MIQGHNSYTERTALTKDFAGVSDRKHSSDVENSLKEKSAHSGQVSEDSSCNKEVPHMIVETIVDDAIDQKGLVESQKNLTFSLLQTKSKKEEASRTSRQQPRTDEADAGIAQVKLVQRSSAAEKVSLSDFDGLAKRLNVELDGVRSKCIGFTKKGSRCKNDISKSSRIEATAILKRLAALDIRSQATSYSEELWVLACLVLCKRNHQDKVKKTVKTWTVSLACTGQSIDDTNSVKLIVASQTSLHGLTCPSTIVESVRFPINVSVDINFLPTGHSGSRIGIRNFEPYETRAKSRIAPEISVEQMLKRDLTPREAAQDGFIYIYWFEGNFGHIKIGVTTLSPEERLKKWENQCGHVPRLEYPKPSEERQRIPHVFRVEALVHAQLQRCRRRELNCKNCGRSHKEWFECAPAEAIAAVKKWAMWMKTEPYEMSTTQVWNSVKKCHVAKPTGKLKSEYEHDIQNICKIVPSTANITASQQLPRSGLRFLSGSNGFGFRARSTQPVRRSDRLAKKRRNAEVVNGEDNGPKFSDEFMSTLERPTILLATHCSTIVP